MTITKINTDTTTAVEVTGSNSVVTVTSHGSIARFAVNDDVYAINDMLGATGSRITVDGFVIGTIAISQLLGAGIFSQGQHTTIDIGSHGSAYGDFGIESRGTNVDITNRGNVSATGTAVSLEADRAHLDNRGVIASDVGVAIDGNGSVVVNEASGRILAYGESNQSVFFHIEDGSHGKFINHGSVNASVVSATGNTSIVNDGIIDGNILLTGSGHHRLDLRGGTVHGLIQTGTGADMLITDRAGIHLDEQVDGGIDTVKSTVSYTLTANVEKLVLLGKANINGTDSTDFNDFDHRTFLVGNAGRNILFGIAGFNELRGNAGNDQLLGGTGSDVFDFSKGFDHDTITNFQEGEDKISVFGFKDATTLAGIESHLERHGNDTWLDFGADVLIVKGMHPNQFSPGDFLFN